MRKSLIGERVEVVHYCTQHLLDFSLIGGMKVFNTKIFKNIFDSQPGFIPLSLSKEVCQVLCT
jgi:hypothetical protein